MSTTATPLDSRRAGVLLHPTSLPGGVGVGDLGPDAYRFVDWLSEAGMRVWQMLPLVPTHGDLSPYQGLSVHAGNPLLISPALLREWGWLDADIDSAPDNFIDYRIDLLKQAQQGFLAHASGPQRDELQDFVGRNDHWLQDYALFQALRLAHGNRPWLEWPAALRDRDPAVLAQAERELAESVAFIRFEQFAFFRQWQALHDYARQRGVLLFGDMPIFVAHDSAEVWAHREYFTLDAHGRAEVVAGVPPDYFSETGQRWGNPHYRWDRMQADGFQWWKARMQTQLSMFDWVRIDHFRGFEAYWEIPASEETAINGHWVEAPGDALFEALHEEFDPLPLVAEDLGTITAEVEALRKKYALPGMKILQFAFGGAADNPYLPHNQTRDSVVYTGTHDNDTTLGWYEALPEQTRGQVRDYLGHPGEDMPWPLIRSALASVACLAVIPMQDLLGLDGAHRMNTPGTQEGDNWRWRFQWEQVSEDLAPRLKHRVSQYGRD